jgi:hypothetical protein
MSKSALERMLAAAVIGLAVPSLALGAAMSSSEYSKAKDNANMAYKSAKAQCDALSGNPKDICVAEAKANLKKARADAEAQYKNTDKARRDAKIAEAEANYDVAKAKCDAKTGNEKDVCIKEAKAAETKAKVDAKATEKIAAIREDAREDKMSAEYKVAIEKCDSLSGSAKDACVANAKAKYKP